MTNKATIALTALSLAVSFPVFAEYSVSTKVGAEIWAADTKVNEVRRDSSTTGAFYAAIEHDVKYVPNARLRYSSIDADYMGFNKLDFTMYYQILEHDLLHFDAGVTFSNLSDTKYIDAGSNKRIEEFDELIWAWYGYAEIQVPDTNFDVIGEINFGDNKGIKSTDFMAGVQYHVPLEKAQLAFRGGYRVIDLESEKFMSDLGKEFIFANGFFVFGISCQVAGGELRGDHGVELRDLLERDEQESELIERIQAQLQTKSVSHFLHDGNTGMTPHLASIGG